MLMTLELKLRRQFPKIVYRTLASIFKFNTTERATMPNLFVIRKADAKALDHVLAESLLISALTDSSRARRSASCLSFKE